jgi:predicted nucleic acid-binding protein
MRGAGVLYLDASALVKLVLPEVESAALAQAVADHPVRASSALAAAEVRRATRAATEDPTVLERAERVLAGTTLIAIDDPILRAAGDLEPRSLRTLDAIHLASALRLGDELDAVAVYDSRLAGAAARAGLSTVSPGS